MQKYSILSVASSQFEEFLWVFLKSALDKINLDSVYEICILDIGLSEEIMNYFEKLNPKIKFLKSEEVFISNESWDDAWQKNVLKKTEFVKDYLQKENVPVYMIDIDCMFLDDVSDLLNIHHERDIILCDRSDLWAGMPYIASFVAFLNIEQSIKFLDDWIQLMDQINQFETKETPALNELARTNTKYNLYALSHKIVGLYYDNELIPETKIIHFKGGGSKDNHDLITDRFNRFNVFSEIINKYMDDKNES